MIGVFDDQVRSGSNSRRSHAENASSRLLKNSLPIGSTDQFASSSVREHVVCAMRQWPGRPRCRLDTALPSPSSGPTLSFEAGSSASGVVSARRCSCDIWIDPFCTINTISGEQRVSIRSRPTISAKSVLLSLSDTFCMTASFGGRWRQTRCSVTAHSPVVGPTFRR